MASQNGRPKIISGALQREKTERKGYAWELVTKYNHKQVILTQPREQQNKYGLTGVERLGPLQLLLDGAQKRLNRNVYGEQKGKTAQQTPSIHPGH